MIRKALKSAITLSVAAAAGQAFASGFAINEQSVSSMGTACAGRSSSAEDATTVFGNPAGMSRLKRQEITVGATMINIETDIDDASGTFPGSNEGDMVPFATVPYLDWHDAWAYAVGAAYKLNRQWTLRGGIALDQSPTNNTYRSPRIPTGDRTLASLGFGWQPTPDITVDAAYMFIKEEDTDIDLASATQGTYQATYKNTAHLLGAQLSYRF